MNTWIEEILQGTIDLYGTCDPFDLCDYLDITAKKVGTNSPILRRQQSIYFRNFGNQECIFYAEGQRYKRLKFYLLHELGHALIHPDVLCSKLTNRYKMERQANYFAVRMIICDQGLGDCETIEQFALVNDIPMEVFKNVI